MTKTEKAIEEFIVSWFLFWKKAQKKHRAKCLLKHLTGFIRLTASDIASQIYLNTRRGIAFGSLWAKKYH